MDAYLAPGHIHITDELKGKYDEAKKSITVFIDDFIQSGFQNYDRLYEILCSLKSASVSDNPKLPTLKKIYETTQLDLTKKINEAFVLCIDLISQSNCYYKAIDVLTALDRQLKRGLRYHLLMNELSFDCQRMIQEWKYEQRKIEDEMDFDRSNSEEKMKKWSSLMDGLDPKSEGLFTNLSRAWVQLKSGTTYHIKVRELHKKAIDRSSRGLKALENSDYRTLQECIDFLDLIDRNLGKHVPIASRESEASRQRALGFFLDICKKAHVIMESNNRNDIEKIFKDYRDIVLNLPFITASDEGKKAFSLTNQLMHDALVKDISNMKEYLESFDFAKFYSKVISTRKFGSFLADHCTLLHECVKTSDGLHHIEHFAILNIPPSSNQSDVERAYRSLSKRYHPGKTGINDSAMFRKVKEA
eukprot:9362907-Ditylum_brightwellii.AAC.1